MRGVTIIGPGRAGGALAIALSRADYRIDRLVYRTHFPSQVLAELGEGVGTAAFDDAGPIESDVVILAVADDVIAETASRIRGKLSAGAVVLHTSGALSSDELKPLESEVAGIGSMHPLLSISDPVSGAESIRGVYFCVEGTAPAVTVATALAKAVGGIPFHVEPAQKALYHASAVMAAGHVTALFSLAVAMLARCGPDAAEAHRILLPLLESTVRNLSDNSASTALTGPFARLDRYTVERHVAALKDAGLELAEAAYLDLALSSLDLAQERGGDPATITEMREQIKDAREGTF